MPPRLKRCSRCRNEKPLSAFGRDRKGRYGVKSACRACIAEIVKGVGS